jgi:hypothetical protein
MLGQKMVQISSTGRTAMDRKKYRDLVSRPEWLVLVFNLFMLKNPR